MIATAGVEHALAAGRDLHAWWAAVEAGSQTVERFVLVPGFPGGDAVRGFFGDARIGGTATRLMGYAADYFFDLGGSPETVAQTADWLADQAEEFALRYWLRTEAWALPQPYGRLNPPPLPAGLAFLVPRAQTSPELRGMTNVLRTFKRRADGVTGEFPAARARTIVDLRELETTYAWITIERVALDLAIKSIDLVPGRPELSISLPVPGATTLALSADLIVRQRHAHPGVVGEFGAGFCPTETPSGSPSSGLKSGLRLQTLRVLETAEVRLRTVTIMNRSRSVAQAKHLLTAHALHLRDHLLGTRAVWQQVNDWLDPDRIPDWVVNGRLT